MTRTFKRHLTPADRRAKEVIKAAVAGGVGIDYLADASRFRYSPIPLSERPLDNGPPSHRGSVKFPDRLKLRNWKPARGSLQPQYDVPMAGDPWPLTEARRAWHKGNPEPLRDYLAAESRRRARNAEITLTTYEDAA